MKLKLQSFASASLLTASAATLYLGACVSRQYNNTDSDVTTTRIPHTSIKRQSVGNCWIYAVVAWIESQVWADTNGRGERNISESYYTYRHYQTQLLESGGIFDYPMEKVQTGGTWHEMQRLITEYGVMKEGDFAPEEHTTRMSARQAKAEAYINDSLKRGKLKNDRSPQTVTEELDKAFGVKMSELQRKIIPADRFFVRSERNRKVSLAEEVLRWNELPLRFDGRPSNRAVVPGKLTKNDKKALIQAIDHLNQERPVIAVWWVNFNAENGGVFSRENLESKGLRGREGGHMTVLADYVAHGVNERTGERFQTSESEVASQDLKDLVIQYGEIDYFVTKNSWGKKRADRGSYKYRGIQDGYSRLDASYMFSFIPLDPQGEHGNYGIPANQGLMGVIVPDYGLSSIAEKTIARLRSK